eukprot:CAMPEP_0197177370 /NCGR_PEP_ID=MMETSP1423-20130617/2998_1 /TAXON_ID=476441 /ORGANISM="Pseudo-nitzschia heimii, Strain UNC1101" /LENGTH=54 /DNA_ID=CAMNT_0042626905 /DNA_START=107 /DNA_END=268 /DNA_ORIENTATION=-
MSSVVVSGDSSNGELGKEGNPIELDDSSTNSVNSNGNGNGNGNGNSNSNSNSNS